MRVEACADAIDADRAAGVAPIAVVATAGTTLTGAVDPLDELADVCAQRGVWLHVDGAYGLPAALVESHAPLFRGLARADSVTVDAHKWLFVPKACGVLMVREAEWLERAFSHEATYVPHELGEQDAVDRTLEYSRPFRALKLWLALRVHGLAAFRSAIERNLAEARLFADLVKERDELELLGEPELSVVPFRHIATSGRWTSTTARSPPPCAPTGASTSRAPTSTAPPACGRASSTSGRAPRTCACCATSCWSWARSWPEADP